MKTDSVSYRFFQELPENFFELVGRPTTDAARYRFDAIELKDTAVRLDGVFTPIEPADTEPMYFAEFQNYKSDRTYSNLLLKVALFLDKVNPRQNWQAVIMYPDRSAEQDYWEPYRVWLDSDQMKRIYLNELPEPGPGQIGQGILRLIVATPEEAVDRALHLIPEVRASTEPPIRQKKLIELIETVMLYQLPNLSRKELEKMLKVNSFRETKVYQEAHEEGMEEGIEKGIEKGRQVGNVETAEAIARRMLLKKMPIEDIAELTGLVPSVIKRIQKSKRGK